MRCPGQDSRFPQAHEVAPLYDADLMVNRVGRSTEEQRNTPEQGAWTETGLRVGRERLGL